MRCVFRPRVVGIGGKHLCYDCDENDADGDAVSVICSQLSCVQSCRPDSLFLKHGSSILRQSSNPVCGSWKSQAHFLCGLNTTEPYLIHHGETTYLVATVSLWG